jgi:hypothetical protein
MLHFIFYTWNDVTSLTISVATQSLWSHVELALPEYKQSWGSVRAHGVASFDLTSRINNSAKALQVIIPATPKQEYKVKDFVYSQLGKPYDIWGALGVGIGRDWQDDHAWFCSELMAAALIKANYPGAKRAFSQSWRVTPANIKRFLALVPNHKAKPLKLT